jgi:hypothetical protein
MAQRSFRRAHLSFELLEARYNLSTPTLIANMPLPGANTSWDFSKGPFNPSPIVYDLFGDGQQEIITPGGDGNVYAYKYNKSTGAYDQVVEYFTGSFGAGVPIYSTPLVVNLPSGLAVFAGNAHGFVFGWNAQTGAILPGWPQSVQAPGEAASSDPTIDGIFGSIAAGDLENDGSPDIVVPSFNHEITAFRSNGTVFWRFNNDDTVFSGVAIGDLHRDGHLEVVVGGDSSTSQFYWQGGRINCLSWEGKREWVVQTDQVIWSSPALADLQGNGFLDVVVGTGLFVRSGNAETGNEVFAIDPNGNILPGWPFITGPGGSTVGNAPVQTSPAVADLLGNGQLDVVFADFAGNLYAVAPNGQQIWKTAAYPGQGLYGSPVVGPDILGKGGPDVILGGVDGGSNSTVLQVFDGATGNALFSYPGSIGNVPLPQYNAAAVGHFLGDSSYQMAIVANNYGSQGDLLSPSYLEIFDLGTSTVPPPWGQMRQDGTADAVARSATFSANLITNLYKNALGRSPTSAELNSQLANFVHAPSLAPFIQGILGSAEAQSRLINSWYQTYLNRAPDPGGFNGFVNLLNAGQSYSVAQAAIVSSQEAFNDGGGTNTAYVTYLYQKILARTPGQSEANGWVSALNAGTLTRLQLASAFFHSAECSNRVVEAFYAAYQPAGLTTAPPDDLEAMGMDLRSGHTEVQILTRMLTANGDYVTTQPLGSWIRALYQDVLGRTAGPGEVASWLTSMEGGASMASVANAFISSPEANGQLVSTPQYPPGPVRVGALQGYYQHFLGRTPGAAEAATWVNALSSGASRNSVIAAFLRTDEYFNLAGGTPTGFIDKVFNDLLGRPPAASNLQQWQGDANVRIDLPNAVLAGAPNEYFMDEVTLYYNAYLRRFPNTPPDQTRLIQSINPFGGQAFVDALNAGASPMSVQVGILTSAEYQNIALFKEFWGGGGRWLS